MFYLIGASHRAQTKHEAGNETEDQKRLRACLERAVADIRPVVIAEELSQYALQQVSEVMGREQESLAKEVAGAAKLEHCFCDPDASARTQMGYVQGSDIGLTLTLKSDMSGPEASLRGYAIEAIKYWPLRERFWLDQLADAKAKEVLFICGDAHVENFQKLLADNGIDSALVARGIGLTKREVDFWNDVQSYIKNHSRYCLEDSLQCICRSERPPQGF